MENPKYTLPGVMHYLQSEFTNMDKYKILNNLELLEMKFKIAQLEGERASLLKLNQGLSQRVKELEAKCEALALSPLNPPAAVEPLMDVMDVPITLVDLEPIKRSRDMVTQSMKEIMYLLKTPAIDNYDLLNLNAKLDFFPLSKEGETPDFLPSDEGISFTQSQAADLDPQQRLETAVDSVERTLNEDIDNLSLHSVDTVEDIPQPSVSPPSSPTRLLALPPTADDDAVYPTFQIPLSEPSKGAELYLDRNSERFVVAHANGSVAAWSLALAKGEARRVLSIPKHSHSRDLLVISAENHFYTLCEDLELLMYATSDTTAAPVARGKLGGPDGLPASLLAEVVFADIRVVRGRTRLLFVSRGRAVCLHEVTVVGSTLVFTNIKCILLDDLGEDLLGPETVLITRLLPFHNQVVVATSHRYLKYDFDSEVMTQEVPNTHLATASTPLAESIAFVLADILDNVLLVHTPTHQLIAYNLLTDTRIYSKTFSTQGVLGISLVGGNMGCDSGERGPDDFSVVLTHPGNVIRVLNSKFHLVSEYVFDSQTNRLVAPTQVLRITFKSRVGMKKIKGPEAPQHPMTFVRLEDDLCALILDADERKGMVNVFQL